MTGTLGWLMVAVIAMPLGGACLPLALDRVRPRLVWPITTIILIITAVLAAPLVAATRHGPIHYEIGNIPASYGIELVADGVSAVLVALTIGVVLGAVIHTRRAGPTGGAVHSGLLLLTGGTLGISLTGDLFNLYVFLEISAIASYALIASADSRVSTYAAFKYLILGTIGASLYLLGVAYVFIATGTLNMAAVAEAFAAVGYGDPLVVISFVFVAVGLAIKIALVPVHTWLADAHAMAPDAISAIVSGVLPAIAVYALARVALTVFTPEFFLVNPVFGTLLIWGGLATVVGGSIFAILQRKIKLILAYSTVAHMGLAVVGVALATEQALYGALIQLFGHGIAKAGLFLLAGVIGLVYGARSLDDYTGLAKRSPLLAAAFAILGLSLIGLPPTIGFMGKYYIVIGALEAGSWLVAAVVLASTLLTVGYIFPIIDRLYFRTPEGEFQEHSPAPRGTLGTVFIATALAVILGFVTVPVATAIGPAIEVMFG